MIASSRKREAPSQNVITSSSPYVALPSKRPRHMLSEDELNHSTGRPLYIIVPDSQMNNDDSGKKRGTSAGSLDDESRSNPSLPSSSPSIRTSQSGGARHSRSKRNRSQIIIDHDENDPFDPNFGVNGPLLNIDFDEVGERRQGGDHFLWNGVRRGKACKSSAAHKNVLIATKPYLLAMIYGGPAGSENSGSIENRKPWFEDTMKRAWKIMRTHIGRTAGKSDHDVAPEPTPEEARCLYDAVNGWRSRAIQIVRFIVGSSYPWRKCRTPEDVTQLSKELLKEDRFTCLEWTADPPKGRFCAHIISAALGQTIWNSKLLGMARQSYTKEFFDPLPDAALVFICTCIEHAIREYETGRFSFVRFRGKPLNEVETRIRKAFDSQADARKNIQRKVLLQRIHKQIQEESIHKPKNRESAHENVDRERSSAGFNMFAVAYPDSESLEDPLLHELMGSEEHQDDLRNQRNGLDFSGLGSCTFQSFLDTIQFHKDPLEVSNSINKGSPGEDSEDRSTSLNNTRRVKWCGRLGDFAVRDDLEISKSGKMASERPIAEQVWTGGDLWAFLETAEGSRSRSTSCSGSNAPNNKTISDEEEYDRFIQLIKIRK